MATKIAIILTDSESLLKYSNLFKEETMKNKNIVHVYQ